MEIKYLSSERSFSFRVDVIENFEIDGVNYILSCEYSQCELIEYTNNGGVTFRSIKVFTRDDFTSSISTKSQNYRITVLKGKKGNYCLFSVYLYTSS